jgi:ribose-phosphate pyrophosphokinase
MSTGIKFFAGSASKILAKSIAGSYGKELGKVQVTHFSDGEFQPRFMETVRGKDVYIIQSTYSPVENLFELLLMVDAAKRASAKQIVAVIPYFGFSRQDRKDNPRVAISAKLVANLLTAAGITRIMTMDLHADQIQGFFDVPVDHLFASAIFIPYLKDLGLKEGITMSSPDTGGTRRANAYAKHLGTDFVICYKQRRKPNEIDTIRVIGDVEGKNIIIVDDIVDTAGTLTKAADMMMNQGAKSVRALCTHAILSGQAYEKLENSLLTELVVTDTVPLKQESDKIKVLSTSALFADVINKVYNFESISSHFIF